LQKTTTPPPTFPFLLFRKKFYPKDDVELFWKCMKDDSNGRRYYDDGKRCHKSSGMMIFPDEAFTKGKSANIFEWKFINHHYVLFLVQRHEETFSLFAETSVGESECLQTSFPREDTERIRKDWNTFHGHNANSALVECAFDTTQGSWRYIRMKPSLSSGAGGAARKAPDDISSVCEMLVAMGENITKDELLYRIRIKSSENDDWLKRSGQAQW